MPAKPGHRGFGYVRRLPSKRWQASYVGPDVVRHTAPSTFEAKQDAEDWLLDERRLVASGKWTSPARRAMPATVLTLDRLAAEWLTHRELKPRTRSHYQSLLDTHILPTLGSTEVDAITPATVRAWHAATLPGRPTLRAHAYSLLRTILNAAVADRLISSNPCTVRGAGSAKRASKTEAATLDELATIIDEVPERYKLMILFAAWCAMRFGELTELRGKDIDTRRGVIKIRRAVAWVDSRAIIGKPKSDAGTRDVAIPPHVMPAVRRHLATFRVGADDLLFPAASDSTASMRPATLSKVFYRARAAAGRDDLRFHDLRHTGAVLAAATGATLAELMARLGHSTPAAAMRYQTVAKGRDAEIALKLTELAAGRS